MKRIISGIIIFIIIFCTTPAVLAADSVTIKGELTEVYTYYGTVEVSAYYPGEDGYHTNHRSVALADLVDEIIATQTRGGHSDLLGKTVMLVTPGGERLIRKVDDRGCYKGRLDLLVANRSAMNDWGLVDCEVWVLEEDNNDE